MIRPLHFSVVRFTRPALWLALSLALIGPGIAPAYAGPPPAGQTQHLQPGQVPAGLTQAEWRQITAQLEQQRYKPAATAWLGPYQAGNPLAIDSLAQAQQVYLKASNTRAGDQFGWSVATSGDTVAVGTTQAEAVYIFVRSGGVWSQQAYLQASNTEGNDQFGIAVALSGDTLVVGARYEASSATGVNGNEADNSAHNAGAAYVFVRSGGVWSQQAYLKASNTGAEDEFGRAVAISGDTLVVGASLEDSSATGVNGNEADNSAFNAGAVYIFVRSGTVWSQQAYLKASNTGAEDHFGDEAALSGDTLVVGADGEASSATGVNGNEADNSAFLAGAAYVFVRSGTVWSQQAYLKASNTEAGDSFGSALALSGDTLVAATIAEDSSAAGVNGNQADNSAFLAGAAYVFVRAGTVWSQQAYLKASNPASGDYFGRAVALSGDTLIVGASDEDSSATGVNGDQTDNSAFSSGAVYIFVRSGTVWSQQAYLKASNPGMWDFFGQSVAISGEVLVVGAPGEDSSATGVNGNQADNSAYYAGAAYTFELGPEIEVSGNNTAIAAGDSSPSPADDTDFGGVTLGGAITHTFIISNSGTTALNLTGTPLVALAGPAAGDFSLVVSPTTLITPGGTTTFAVRFTPTVTGTRVATVTIASNDSNENPYDFAIQGGSRRLYLPHILKRTP